MKQWTVEEKAGELNRDAAGNLPLAIEEADAARD
jgi:hypothetical protein